MMNDYKRGNSKRLKWGAAALLLLMTISLVFAQEHGERRFGPPGGGPPPFGPGGPPMRFLRELNLTDDQKTKVQQITESTRQSTKTYMDQLKTLHVDPFDADASGTFDEAAVRANAEKRAAIQVELEVAHARMMSQIFGLLTAEQKAKLAELKQSFAQKRQAWESHRQPPTAPDSNQ
jgi:Spy/CpxP family protein refolding chaperone